MFNMKYIFKGSIFQCYVRLPECNNQKRLWRIQQQTVSFFQKKKGWWWNFTWGKERNTIFFELHQESSSPYRNFLSPKKTTGVPENVRNAPLKTNMEPENHPFEKEIHLPYTFVSGFKILVFRVVFISLGEMVIKKCKSSAKCWY